MNSAGLPSDHERRRSNPGQSLRRFCLRHALLGFVLLLSLACVAALMTNTRSNGVSGNTADERAVSYVEAQLRAQGSPRSAFAVVRSGDITESGAVGQGIDVDTPFLLGSLSKSFTALAVMQLVDDQRIALDEPVTLYIPWFRTADPSAVITVRQLLDQTSGLPTWAGTVDLSEPEITLEQRVRAVADVSPVSAPGAEFHYCNKNYAILGLLVEEVTGMPYGDYLRQSILDPLGMDRTFTSVASARSEGLVDGSNVWFGWHVAGSPADLTGFLPDGSLVSTVADLSHYIQAQRDGIYLGRRIVSEESLGVMHSGRVDDDLGSRYGFGWRDAEVEGQRVIQHEGDLSNYHANLGMLTVVDGSLVVLTAHNSQLFDTSGPYAGGVRILAGGTTPSTDRSYLIVGAVTSVLAIAEVAALTSGTLRLVRRIGSARSAKRLWWRSFGIPAVGYLAVSGTGAAMIYSGLRFALQDELVVTPGIMFAALPDVSTMVAAALGWLALAGVSMLVAGIGHQSNAGT